MPWWKRSSSSRSPSSSSPSPRSASGSPRRARSIWGRRDAGPRLIRQRKLRHLGELEVGRFSVDGASYSASSTPVCRSPSNLETGTSRCSSSPVPLPLPENFPPPQYRESGLGSGVSPGGGGCPLPSPKGALNRAESEEVNGNTAVEDSLAQEAVTDRAPTVSAVGRLSTQIVRKGHGLFDTPSDGSAFSRYRKLLKDQNSVDALNFRLNIPAKSAPTSGFSSPVRSPRRLSSVDFIPPAYNSSQGLHIWSAPEIPSAEVPGFSPRTSPENIIGSPDCSPLYSPSTKSPVLRSRNPSAPPSPLHYKMFPEGSAGWHDSNSNINVYPLPLPPGPAVSSQSGFAYQSTAKTEATPMTNQWQKGKLIGSGTFGNVYVATNKHTGALCAMKEVNIIPDDPKSAECLKQLEQEVKLLSQLKHQNIVQYYGSETIDDRLYIYLEYVYPGSINKYVREHCGAMTESVVRNFTHHILKGLAFLHKTNTMHRDIKGANLLVDANGVVKLADFGMAKHLSGAAAVMSLRGTPYWMAPEVVQATMNKDIGYDLAVDIWSLGCTIIEMFTGKHPWSDLEGAAAMFKVLHKDPPIPETLSSEGKEFLQLCFRRNPAERPTASMLLEHSFIRNTNHYNLHGSIQAFAAVKLNDNRSSPRERKVKNESTIKGKQLSNGEANHSHPETSESAASRFSPLSTLESVPSLSPPHANHVGSILVGSSTKNSNGLHSNGLHSVCVHSNGVHSVNGVHSNGVHSSSGNHHPCALPKPHV